MVLGMGWHMDREIHILIYRGTAIKYKIATVWCPGYQKAQCCDIYWRNTFQGEKLSPKRWWELPNSVRWGGENAGKCKAWVTGEKKDWQGDQRAWRLGQK